MNNMPFQYIVPSPSTALLLIIEAWDDGSWKTAGILQTLLDSLYCNSVTYDVKLAYQNSTEPLALNYNSILSRTKIYACIRYFLCRTELFQQSCG